MKDSLNNFWHLTRGIRLQLIAAVVLVGIIAIILLSFFRTPDPETELSATERTYPEATPQPFRHQEEKDTGTLVVTSNVPDATVLLDAEEHPSPEDPIPRGQKWPHNKTPLRVDKMPVGKHVLFAIKPPTHDMATVAFEIKKNQVTRVYIELIPLRITK